MFSLIIPRDVARVAATSERIMNLVIWFHVCLSKQSTIARTGWGVLLHFLIMILKSLAVIKVDKAANCLWVAFLETSSSQIIAIWWGGYFVCKFRLSIQLLRVWCVMIEVLLGIPKVTLVSSFNKLSGATSNFRALQQKNTISPISVTLFRIVIEVRFLQ